MARGAALLVALALLTSAALAAQGPPPPRVLPTGSSLLVGRVVDADTGAPIASAVVAISVTNATGRASSERVLTDGRGRFFFSGLGAGSFTLTATKPGWIEGASGRKRPDGPLHPVDIRDGQPPAELAIPLWRYGVIAGRLVDDADEPLVGVDVRIFQGGFAAGRRQWTFVSRALTDDRGAYRFSQLLPGSYLVVVPTAVTAEPASLRGPAGLPNAYYQTMSPIGAAPMSFDAARMPIGGGTLVTSIVSLPRPPTPDGPWLTYPTTYFPAATTIDRATVVEATSGRERANVDIVMRAVPTFTVAGSIVMPEGMAAGDHAVHLVPADSAVQPLFDVATAVTNAAGDFTFYGVPAGQYIARIVRTPPPAEGSRFGICGGTGAISYLCTTMEKPTAGYPPVPAEPLLHADAPVTVADRGVRGVRLELVPGARVSGRVEFEGAAKRPTPAEWRALWVGIDPAGGQMFRSAGSRETRIGGRVEEDGRFVLPSVWPGRYVIILATPPPGWSVKSITAAGRDVADTPLVLDADRDDVVITLTDQIARLSGTVQALSGRVEEDISVLLFPADPARWVDYGQSTRRLRVVPTAAGAYSTPLPPDGDYLLIAVPEAQLVDWQNPAFLKRAVPLAERISVRAGQSLTQALRTRSLP